MLIPLALYVLALAVRLVLVAVFPDPAYADSAYYVDVARTVAAGHGFNVDFIWIFAEVGGSDPGEPGPADPLERPLDAARVDRPGAVHLAARDRRLRVRRCRSRCIGAIAAPLTWAIARDAGARAPVAVGAGVLVAIPGLMTIFMSQPDNFWLYQPLVAGALWMAARGLKGHPRSFALGGLLVGPGDAVAERRRARRRGAGADVPLRPLAGVALRPARRPPAIPWSAAIGCVALFFLVMAPWWIRQLAVFGSLSPSTASGKVLFIRDIGEWNSITTPATLDHLLGMGLGPLLDEPDRRARRRRRHLHDARRRPGSSCRS